MQNQYRPTLSAVGAGLARQLGQLVANCLHERSERFFGKVELNSRRPEQIRQRTGAAKL
jgi:hypothetical protein